MLIDRIRADMTAAAKAKDTVRLRTLRSAIAAVQEAQVAGAEAVTLDDEEVQQVVAAQVKRRVDAAEAFEAGGRTDRAAEERAEIEVLEAYLPAALTDAELEVVVDEVVAAEGATSMADMGSVMKAITARVGGRADGRRISALVKSKLS